jgi:1-aminocyclopropane-1-carboxylate synthase
MNDLSLRAQNWISNTPGLLKGIQMMNANVYDPITNPSGCISLGIAENESTALELQNYLGNLMKNMHIEPKDFKYIDFSGALDFRTSIAAFLTFNLKVNFDAQEMIIYNGCSSALESLFYALGDHGDCVLCPTPYYGGIEFDSGLRAGLNVVPIHLTSKNGFKLTIESVEEAYEAATRQGHKIKAIVMVNPQNPLGIVYSDDLMQQVIDFVCAKHIHLISDEIYACSIFDPMVESTFKSVYRFKIANPELVHFVWGLSKDFCLNGYRVGVVVTKSTVVMASLKAISHFSSVPSITQAILKQMINDKEFVSEFLRLTKYRLKERYDTVISQIEQFNLSLNGKKHIDHVKSSAGSFVWVDLRQFMPAKLLDSAASSQDVEEFMLVEFIKSGVYIAPGALGFHCAEPGWFRFGFGLDDDLLKLGLSRVFSKLKEWIPFSNE